MMLSICNNSSVLELIWLIKFIINVITVLAPILLIVSGMLSFSKALLNPDDFPKIAKNIVNKIIACAIITLVPVIVNVVIELIGFKNEEYSICLNNANRDYIEQLKVEEEAKEEAERNELLNKTKEDREKLKEEQETKTTEENEDDSTTSNNSTSSSSTTSVGGKIVSINTNDLGCTLYYSDHVTVIHSLRIKESLASNLHSILTNICSYTNKNSFIGKFEEVGAYVEKSGYHGLGQAIDIWNQWTYTYNGKTYKPYDGQGVNTWNNYTKFICDVCNGKEDCSKNINYQIYKKYFMPNGWCWGGNWSSSIFDPMHYEYTGSACSLPSQNRITCR